MRIPVLRYENRQPVLYDNKLPSWVETKLQLQGQVGMLWGLLGSYGCGDIIGELIKPVIRAIKSLWGPLGARFPVLIRYVLYHRAIKPFGYLVGHTDPGHFVQFGRPCCRHGHNCCGLASDFIFQSPLTSNTTTRNGAAFCRTCWWTEQHV